MKKALLPFFTVISLLTNAQTWEAVGGNVLGNDIHGFTIWNNQLTVAGSFNNVPCDKISMFDSTNWFCPAGGIGTVVRAVVPYNGNLVAVGDFWNNSQPCTDCNGVAMWDGNAWSNLGTGFNNDVLCVAVWNGNLVAGGDFTTADGNTCHRVAMWNGTNWSAIGGLDTAFNNDVRALAVYNGELWVGGDFSNANGCTACDRIVKWDGSAWVGGNSGVDIQGGLDSTVRVLYTDPVANRLYMGGHFLEVNGDPNCSGVACYDGSVWTPLGSGVDSYVRAITRYNGNIIVGGDFLNAGGVPASRIAKWNPISNTWSAMGSGMDAYLRALVEYKGELYAGGSFHNAGGQTRDYIAKWYETSTAPPAPVAAINLSGSSLCANSCIVASDNTSGSPTNWSWSMPGATPSFSNSQNPGTVCYAAAGQYTITLQACNAGGCNTTTEVVTVTEATASAGNDTVICAGESLGLQAAGGLVYQWSPSSSLTCGNCANPTASPSATTIYTLTVTDANGCSDNDFVTVLVDPCLGFNETVKNGEINVYPSPADEMLYITAYEAVLDVRIYSLEGRIVFAGKGNTADVSRLADGIYILKVTVGGQEKLKKISVSRKH